MLKESEPALKPDEVKPGLINVGPLAQLGQLYNPEVICALRVNALQMLSKAFAPEIHSRIKNLKDGDTNEALAVLNSVDLTGNFVTALGEIAPMMSQHGLELLEEQMLLDKTLPVGLATTTAYFANRNAFRKAFARRIGEEGVAGTYHLRRAERIGPRSVPRELTKEVIAEVEVACSAHFNRRNYGPTFLVRTFESATRIGFVITHGSARAGRAAINRKEERVSRFDRYEKTDVVIFDLETRCAWISALKGDLDFYYEHLGRALFGDGRIFVVPTTFDLSFAKAQDLKTRLLSAGNTATGSVSLKHRAIERLPNGRLFQSAGKNECVTEKYPPLDSYTRTHGEISQVKLHVVPADENVPAGTISVSELSIRLPTTLPENIALSVLFDLGVLKRHGS